MINIAQTEIVIFHQIYHFLCTPCIYMYVAHCRFQPQIWILLATSLSSQLLFKDIFFFKYARKILYEI